MVAKVYTIKKCDIDYKEVKSGKWSCYLINQNIPKEYYLVVKNGYKRITGGSYEIVERKVISLLKKWEKTIESDLKEVDEYILAHEKYIETLRQNKQEDDLPF